MRAIRLLSGVVLSAALAWCAASAQAPKPPALPPINPSIAKLDQTSAALESPVVGVAWLEGKGLLVAACEGRELRTWDKGNADSVRIADAKGVGNAGQVFKGHDAPITAMAGAGATAATASGDGVVIVWDLPAGKPRHTLKAQGPVRALAIPADGKQLATSGDDAVVRLWNPETGQSVRTLEGATDWQLALAFSADGKLLAAGGYDGHVRVWDIGSGKKTVDVFAGQPPPPKGPPPPINVIWSLAFSPDGKLLAVGGSEGRIDQFQPTEGKYVRTLAGHTGTVTALLFHPAGNVLLSGSRDRTIRLWNTGGGQIKQLDGHTAWVQGLALLDQGTRLASAGADQTVRLWPLAEPPKKK
jgi:WD40 repeat protein